MCWFVFILTAEHKISDSIRSGYLLHLGTGINTMYNKNIKTCDSYEFENIEESKNIIVQTPMFKNL